MTQIGSRPEPMVLPSIESWPWQQEQMERTRLYQPRRPRAVAPATNAARTTDGARPYPGGWTRQAAVPRLQQQASPPPPAPPQVEGSGPDVEDLFLPVPSRSRQLRALKGRLRSVRLPRLRPLHVIIFTMSVIAVLMVGLALWAWFSERERMEVVDAGALEPIPITVITVSGTAEGGAAAEASRGSRAARALNQRRWSRRHVRRHHRRRAGRSGARQRQVDVDGILAAGQLDRRRRQEAEPRPAAPKAAPSKQTAVDRYLSNLEVGSH